MQFGIDKINFYIPNYYIGLNELSKVQNKENDFYQTGIGQDKMSVPAPNEDIVTMAANAGQEVLKDVDKESINLLLFATESGIDQSKSAGMYIHHLLGLSPCCRVVELKQACYSATAAIQMAIPYLKQHPDAKVLVIASDIARYDTHSPAEASQGAGAVAILLSATPRILAIEPESGFYAEDAMDFWRPNYRREALVEGKLSCDLYLKALKETWLQYHVLSGRNFSDHAGFCYHVPVPRLAEKAHQRLAKLAGGVRLSNDETAKQMNASLYYARETGNCYTASLYVSLLSLLENCTEDLTDKVIGLYSYGSGCTAEYFSGTVQAGYHDHLNGDEHREFLKQRKSLSFDEYQAFFHFDLPTKGEYLKFPEHDSGAYTLAYMDQHKRFYETLDV